MRVLSSSRKPMRKTLISGFPRALLSLSHSRKRRALGSRSVLVLKTCACLDNKTGTVSSTPRLGARAAYHDEYPRDFGPRIAYTVSLVSDTSRPPIRQGVRERNVGS